MNEKREASSVLELQRLYQTLAADIAQAVENKGAGTVKAYENAINEKVKAAVEALSGANHKFSYDDLPKGFRSGQRDAETRADRENAVGRGESGGDRKGPERKKTARRVLDEQGFAYGGRALSRDTYIELQSATIAAGKDFRKRMNDVISRLEKEGRDTLGNVREAMVEDMKKNGVLSVEYKNGAKMPLEAYASMAARTARTECANLGSIGWALDNGVNYVQMTKIFPTCPICARFQDRVYCIDGKDKRFTALFGSDGPLSRGYASVHPHCRHQFLPYNFKFHTEAEIAAESRRSLNLSVATEDEKNRKAYAAWQAGNRQRNTEMQDYAAMKAYYKAKGQKLPYETLGAYRREARKPKEKRSPTFNAWRNRKLDAATYEHWKSVIGAKNMPETLEKFQQMKYNKDRQREFDLLRQYKETRAEGEISAFVDFKDYQQAIKECDIRFIGAKTPNGAVIQSVSKHLVDRYFGSVAKSRNGVSFEEIEAALKSGVERKERIDVYGRKSIKITLRGVCEVSYNPETRELIQVNPITRSKNGNRK